MHPSIYLAIYLPILLSVGDAVGAVGGAVTPHRGASTGTHVIQSIDSQKQRNKALTLAHAQIIHYTSN